jgi:hypothetical protein
MSKKRIFTFAILAIFIFAAATTINAQSRKNERCPDNNCRGIEYPPRESRAVVNKDEQEQDDIDGRCGRCLSKTPTVWSVLDILKQEMDEDETHLANQVKTIVRYSKAARLLMHEWGVEDRVDFLLLTKAAPGVANGVYFDNDQIAPPDKNVEVYVIRYDDPRGRALPDIRIVMFEVNGTVSQARIFNEGKQFKAVTPEAVMQPPIRRRK